MKKALIIIFMLAICVGIVSAEEKNFEPKYRYCVIEKEPKAKEPVGAVIETAGVFVSKILSATEIACTGERKLTVENETGECRVFPFCATTKVTGEAFDTITFNQLKNGEKAKD
ncbi:MAG: hypothetical protein NC938_05250 [Candidatus Omnitrophica bacterium]|nr:hypothetical protein [Candidatus Omnitrophota bacterium]MCM8791087.1 hypothetical protein [Candidatus Omnitrophota bacterium]